MEPSAFCSISTFTCHHELFGLLLSISIYHPGAKVYLMVDTKTHDAINSFTPKLNLKIKWFIELDKYTGLNRAQMEQMGIAKEFWNNKCRIMSNALLENKDILFLDSDIILLGKINDIDTSKDLGVSPQFITDDHVKKTGYYNAGTIWTRNKLVLDKWIKYTETSRYFEQASIEDLVKEFSYFEFGENYNLQCWRYYLSNESSEQIGKHITSRPNDKLYYKNKPLKFIHTHFLDKRFNTFNSHIIKHLQHAKMYKILLIIDRIVNNKWVIRTPKQPLGGIWRHPNCSYRELLILIRYNNKDVEVIPTENIGHIWLTPYILLYDRDTLLWYNDTAKRSHLLLLGNCSMEKDGVIIKKDNIKVVPWIYWPRKSIVLEKLLKDTNNSILTFEERACESIFIGNFENPVQEKFRNNTNWTEVIEEFHCTKGTKHKFTHKEYLLKIRSARFGLCLRGYGSKCHREVELMSMGTIPIVTPEVSIKSYDEPPIENVHYITAQNPAELKQKIDNISNKKWTEMSKNCHEWYMRNVHSKNTWNVTLNCIFNS